MLGKALYLPVLLVIRNKIGWLCFLVSHWRHHFFSWHLSSSFEYTYCIRVSMWKFILHQINVVVENCFRFSDHSINRLSAAAISVRDIKSNFTAQLWRALIYLIHVSNIGVVHLFIMLMPVHNAFLSLAQLVANPMHIICNFTALRTICFCSKNIPDFWCSTRISSVLLFPSGHLIEQAYKALCPQCVGFPTFWHATE